MAPKLCVARNGVCRTVGAVERATRFASLSKTLRPQRYFCSPKSTKSKIVLSNLDIAKVLFQLKRLK